MLLNKFFVDVAVPEKPAAERGRRVDSGPEDRSAAALELVDATDCVEALLSEIALEDRLYRFDLRLLNTSEEEFVSQLEFNVMSIYSASGKVRILDADNGGTGAAIDDLAVYRFPPRQDPEYRLAPGAVTEPRTLKFLNRAGELFTFDALVTACRFTTAKESGVDDRDARTLGTVTRGNALPGDTGLLRFTVNPLNEDVTVEMLCLRGIRGYVCDRPGAIADPA